MLALLDALLPGGCQACGAPADGRLCTACLREIPRLLRPADPPPGVATAWVLDAYAGPLGALVRRGKYLPDPGIFAWLGDRLAGGARGRLPAVEAVVPVPVPWQRRLVRGFDQAELLARPIARALGVPLHRALRRTRAAEQAGRARGDRAAGARGAFALRPAYDDKAPARVLLVDDVQTTGATARACAEALLVGGSRRVHLLCVAGR